MNRRTVLAGGAAVGASGIAGCLSSMPSLSSDGDPLRVTGDWPRVEFDAGATGQNPDVTGPTDDPSVRWDAAAPVDSTHVPAVVVADGTVFVAGGSTVTALEGSDGSRVWQTQVASEYTPGGGRGLHCSAALGADHVFVGTHEGLTALARDGTEAWSHEVDIEPGYSGVFRSPAVVDDTVYFCTAAESEVCAYTTDGDERWRYSLESPALGGPAVADGRVFVGTDDGLHALSAEGDHLWTADAGQCTVTPTAIDGRVYAAGQTGRRNFLGAFGVETGTERWLAESAPSIVGPPAIFDRSSSHQLAVTSWHGTVFTYDRDDGELMWGAPIATDDVGSPRFPATDDRFAYAAGTEHVAGFAPWADRAWQVRIDGLGGNVAVTDGAAFVGSTAGRCYAIA